MNWSSIIANFQTFNLADLLDVLVVTFVIYQILGIVSRTRAGQLARGALVVALIYLIATTANMRTVTWIMDSLLQVGLLTLVVVFQPEIRRALERMGQTDQWFLKFFRVRHVDPATRGSWRSAIIAICDRRVDRAGTPHRPVRDRAHRHPGGLRGQPRSTGHHLL